MNVRCKFRVHNIDRNPDGTGSVAMTPVYSGSPENEEFFRFTPAGDIKVYTVNAAALAQFDVGKEFYVDFTPAG